MIGGGGSILVFFLLTITSNFIRFCFLLVLTPIRPLLLLSTTISSPKLTFVVNCRLCALKFPLQVLEHKRVHVVLLLVTDKGA
jgi:hypothetical protein